MKKIIAITILSLFLTACIEVNDSVNDKLLTSGGVATIPMVNASEVAVPITESPGIEVIRPIYYHSSVWDYCMIGGQRFDNVSFTWTDLGMAMLIDNELIYRPNLQDNITECRTTLKDTA